MRERERIGLFLKEERWKDERKRKKNKEGKKETEKERKEKRKKERKKERKEGGDMAGGQVTAGPGRPAARSVGDQGGGQR